MTNHEAIKMFKERLEKHSHRNIVPEYLKAMEMAIKALEKQIPKKPGNKIYSFYPHSTLLKNKYGKCPICKSDQVWDEYCANCGQKLDWSEKE